MLAQLKDSFGVHHYTTRRIMTTQGLTEQSVHWLDRTFGTKLMIKLYHHKVSGNSHQVRLMPSLLSLEYELIPVDLLKGEHKSPQFLKLNPLGQVPVLKDGNVIIRDAQAILYQFPKVRLQIMPQE